jgi:hypothetical protein
MIVGSFIPDWPAPAVNRTRTSRNGRSSRTRLRAPGRPDCTWDRADQVGMVDAPHPNDLRGQRFRGSEKAGFDHVPFDDVARGDEAGARPDSQLERLLGSGRVVSLMAQSPLQGVRTDLSLDFFQAGVDRFDPRLNSLHLIIQPFTLHPQHGLTALCGNS